LNNTTIVVRKLHARAMLSDICTKIHSYYHTNKLFCKFFNKYYMLKTKALPSPTDISAMAGLELS